MKTCLIVDDSKVIRKFVKKIMDDLSFTSTEAENGVEAMAECQKAAPDCIMLDWNMPVMDGMEFLKALRKESKWASVVVIFCTTENDVTKIQQAISEGANEYIMKPFDKEIVRTKLIQTGVLSS